MTVLMLTPRSVSMLQVSPVERPSRRGLRPLSVESPVSMGFDLRVDAGNGLAISKPFSSTDYPSLESTKETAGLF